jgi:peptidoglycan hydrolase-like protein with peptidoglycan-binding domain
MKKTVLVTVVSLLVFSSASAMTREEMLAEIQRLTMIAEALGSQIRALGVAPQTYTTGTQGTNTSTTGTPRYDSTSSCARISGTLRMGMSSAQVVTLQDALASVGVFAGSSTGYYGLATAASVRQFQTVNGFVPNGIATQETTYALYQTCTGGATYAAGGTGGGTGGGGAVAAVDRASLSVSVSASAPRSVTALFAINGTTCSSYQLDWGDNTNPVARTGTTADCVTDNINRQVAHTYDRAGSYTLTLRTIRGNIASSPVVAQSTVHVQ